MALNLRPYHPANRHDRRESERFRHYRHEDLIARDKASLDLFWLRDDSLGSLDELPPPEVLQQEIIDHLEAALAAFRDVAAGLQRREMHGRVDASYKGPDSMGARERKRT